MNMNAATFPPTFNLVAATTFAGTQHLRRPHWPVTRPSHAVPLAPLRILAVDDEPGIREILTLFLSGDGHTVETAPDGISGWERFCAGTWDIVLLDRAMPGMSGCELALKIKQRDPQMPVILVSGSPQRAQDGGGHGATFDAIVRKPFTIASLREGIAQALRLCSML